MLEYRIAIPTYQRAKKQKTLKYLEDIGMPKGRIVMSVQNKKDYEDYVSEGIRDRVGELIFKEGEYLPHNRNALMEHFNIGEKMIMLDDDITMIHKLDGNGFADVDTLDGFNHIVELGFALCAKYRTRCFGLYNVDNAYFMKNNYSERAITIGTFMGLIVGKERFCTEIMTKGDFEYCCQMIEKTGRSIRLNNYSTRAGHFDADGCANARKDPERYRKDAEWLANRYPTLLKINKKKPDEVIFRGR